MGRPIGSKNKHPAIIPSRGAGRPKRRAPTVPKLRQVESVYPPCPGCGGPLLEASLGRRCVNMGCSNWHGVGAQSFKGGLLHNRFKTKELKPGEWAAHGNGAFKVIDYDV